MNKVFIIAEAGVNHNGSIAMAKELIDLAHEAGASAVKFQTFNSKNVVSSSAPKAAYQIENTGNSESQLEMIKKLELSQDDHFELLNHCHKRNIQFLSTPFDINSAFFLVNKMGIKFLKIPSGEITNFPFLIKIAQFQLPIILSTGMSTLGEIEDALRYLAFGYTQPKEKPTKKAVLENYINVKSQRYIQKFISILHCTTEYPAKINEVNLKSIDTLASAFGTSVGLSDHTPGITIPIAAVARGATIIEKHFTLDRNFEGPDHKASLEPEELKMMITCIKQVTQALGNSGKIPTKSEWKNREVARRSLVAAREINKGDIWTIENLTCKRPGSGIAPSEYWNFIGKKANAQYKRDELLRNNDDE